MFAMQSRTDIEFESAMTLMESGSSDRTIARLTGVPRSTVSGWPHGRGARLHLRQRMAKPGWRPPEAKAYAHVLGLYLGDGCIASTSVRAAWLVVTLDLAYPNIIDEAVEKVARCFPDAVVRRHLRSRGSAIGVQVSHPVLPFAFPQHGAGRKHLRKIRLEDWQSAITREHTQNLLRGLIHSDGCRCVNHFKTKLPSCRLRSRNIRATSSATYPRTSGKSSADHCDLLGIHWTQSNARNISVSHRHSVALLDQFVGPTT
jgi:hypothetical protein